MLKVIFYLKAGKTTKSGHSPIFAKILFKQECITMATGKSITKERWIFTKNLRSVLKMEKKRSLNRCWISSK